MRADLAVLARRTSSCEGVTARRKRAGIGAVPQHVFLVPRIGDPSFLLKRQEECWLLAVREPGEVRRDELACCSSS